MTWKNYAAIGVAVAGLGLAGLWDHPGAWVLASLVTLAGAGIIAFALNLRGRRDGGPPVSNLGSWWSGPVMLLANFFLVWFGIISTMFIVGLMGAILVDAYTRGGLRGLALALVIMAAVPAFCVALWLRARGDGQSESSREW